MKYLSLFSGIGSPEQALKNLGIKFELVGFSEIDKFAIKSYCKVHDVDESLNLGDITKIDIESLPLDIDLITHGSPCQDFSVAGKGKGADEGTGTRSSLMWNTVATCEYCKPKYVIWENVKNVLSKKHRHNFDKYLDEMDRIGYNNFYQVLNAKDFGVPQNRERIFVVSIRKDLEQEFKFPIGFDNGIRLKDILEDEVEEKYYLPKDVTKCFVKKENSSNVIGNLVMDKWQDHMKRIYDTEKNAPTISTMQGGNLEPKILIPSLVEEKYYINTEKARKLISEYKGGLAIAHSIRPRGFEGQGWKENCPTLCARDYKDPKNVIIKTSKGIGGLFDTEKSKHQAVVTSEYRIRKLTPKECWRLMGFKDEQFNKASEVCSNSQLYKQAGNSIVVNVMEEILKNLIKEG